jgi:tetratricopeptide (TPR) repeat protein
MLALTAIAAPAFPEAPHSRSQALQAIESSDAAARAEAIVWLANQGSLADAPLLEARLRDESPFVRGFAEQGLWLLWSRSGDASLDEQLAQGVAAMQAGRHDEAVALFSEVIKVKPAFAEGWNKRATAYFLAGEYARSIADCDEVLKRNPRHFGALSGLGQVYERMKRYDEALAWFRKALDVNPNLLGVEMEIARLDALMKQKRGKSI